MKMLSALCFLFALLLAPSTHARQRPQSVPERVGAERRVALVIGNNAYEVSPLKNPVNDARDMTKTLSALGFEVLHKEDLSQRDMKRAIREFGAKIRGGAVGLFYYAGHGVQVEGTNYLIPVDAKVESQEEVEYESVDANFVLAQMQSAGNGMNIVILDACRNNPFAPKFRDSSRGLALMKAPTGTLIAYATAPGSVASDGGSKNGIYTQELLKFLQVPGLSIEEVFKRVRTSVWTLTQGKQTTWEASSLTGDFYFSRGGEASDPALSQSPLGQAETARATPQPATPALLRNALPTPDEGVIAGSTYSNKFFGFNLDFPAGWSVQGKETEQMMYDAGKQLAAGEDQNFKAALEAASKNMFSLLVVTKHPVGSPVSFNPMMMCIAERVSQFPGVRRGSDHLFNVRKATEMSQMKAQFGEVGTEKIGGVEFDVMYVSLSIGNATARQKLYAVVRDGFALTFFIIYSNDRELTELERAMRSVKF